MKNLIIIVLLYFTVFITINAQTNPKKEKPEHNITLIGSVKNSFTKWGLGSSKVTVHDEEGNLLGSCFILTYGDRPKKGNEFRFSVPKKNAKYRFHAECEGYEPLDMWYEVKNMSRVRSVYLPDLLMQRDFKHKDDDLDQTLDEVIIKATKIKMYHKGDTIVYNADAFNLPDGSMLDDLIRQMPGAELKDNGEIYINGRKLDFLTLNGKDFFGHNNKIMLDNLPYYTVEQLKVFEQSTVRSKALGHDVDAKLYVMDVRLKKEYSIGFLGNITAAAGTEDRYLGRLFGLRFSDNTRISIFGNSNNVNESRKPGADSEWRPSDLTAGIENRHNGGIDVMIDDSEGKWTESGNATFSWTKTTGESRVASESFLNTGNAFGRNMSRNEKKNMSISLDNTFTIKKPWFIEFRTTAQYNKTDLLSEAMSATFNANPESYGETIAILDSLMQPVIGSELRNITLNHAVNRGKSNGESFSLGQSARILKSLKWGDDLEINGDIRYNNATAKDYSIYDLKFLNSESQDDEYRNRYNNTPSHDYSYNGSALYRFNFLNNLKIELSYRYNQHYRYSEKDRYRLDQIAEDDNYVDFGFGELPSSRELLRMGIDRENSHSSEYLNKNNNYQIFFKKNFKEKHQFNIGLSGVNSDERNIYKSYVLDTVMYRNQWIFTPDISYEYKTNKRKIWSNGYKIQYQMKVDAPDMNLMIPVRNTYNPLAIMIGNPDLKNTTNNFIMLSVNNSGRGWTFFHGAIANIRENMIASGFSFNNSTGVYTYKPENVNGNRYYIIRQSINKNLDRKKLFYISHQLDFNHHRNVDLTTPDAITGQDDLFSVRSIVNTDMATENLNLSFSKGKFRLAASGTLTLRHTTSERENFITINAWDYNYGINGHYTFPGKIHFASDIKMYSRRGYGERSMNTNDLIWNASISRPFFKGKVTAIVQGFDLLQNLSNITYNVNGQGITEVWNRSIPSYVMLHLQYKFHKNPKKKD